MPTQGNKLLFLNIFFWNPGVEFALLLTRNASKNRRKVRMSYHYVPSAYPAVCGIQREIDFDMIYKYSLEVFIYKYSL